MAESEADALLSVLIKRQPLLELVRHGTTDKRELEYELEISRPTIDRAFRNLEEFDIISSSGTDYEMTLFGRYLFEEVTNTRDTVETLEKSKPLLEHLPPDAELPIQVLKDSEILRSDTTAPIRPFQTVRDMLEHCNEFLAVFPVIQPEYLRMVHDETADGEKSGHLFLSEASINSFTERYQAMFNDLLDSETCSLWSIHESVEQAIVLVDNQVVWVGCSGPAGGLAGAIVNDTKPAIEWAQERFDDYQRDGERIFTRGGGRNQEPMRIIHQ
jgi:predicted transcriptional regulator